MWCFFILFTFSLKVYWENGAQISSPHDKEILRCIEQNAEPWAESWNQDLAESSSLRTDPLKDICSWYMEELSTLCFHRFCLTPLLKKRFYMQYVVI